MAYVASALNSILSDLKWTQRELAERCGVPASQINRYSRGVNSVPRESAQKVAQALPQEHRARFLVAYLRDYLPSEFESLVEISPVDSRVDERSLEMILPPALDADLRRMLERFAALGMRHTQVRDMLSSFLRLVDLPREP